MSLISGLATGPMRSLMFVFRSIHDAVEGELESEQDAIRQQLSELYQELEAGRMDEQTFDEAEEELLDRLDEIEEILGGA